MKKSAMYICTWKFIFDRIHCCFSKSVVIDFGHKSDLRDFTIVNYFEVLLESKFYIENEDILTPLITYFESTRIGILDRKE